VLSSTSVNVLNIFYKVFPNTDNGNGWNTALPNPEDALADIYITFQDSNLNVIYDSPTYFENTLSNGSNFFEFILTPQI